MNKRILLSKIRQGGMGVRISGYRLARTVALQGQGGTISGVFLEMVVARILQAGDPGGDIRRALAHFPFPEVAERIINKYYRADGTPPGVPFKGVEVYSINPTRALIELTVCANFAFVWLAKEGHDFPITVNYLEKISMPHIYAITGAMMANIDSITMGAGVALQIPALIKDLYEGRSGTYRVPVIGDNIKSYMTSFNPEEFFGAKLNIETYPTFIPIIGSNLLGSIFMTKLAAGSVDGFVIEEHLAGGHNAPPRKAVYDNEGVLLPIYGDKDIVNYQKISDLGLPFWIGGARSGPETLTAALEVGATGIQAGSIFALCEESDMDPELKRIARKMGYNDELKVRTDTRVSPTDFPFKVAEIGGTIADSEVYLSRKRLCDKGALVSLYERPDGKIGYRCAAEPVHKFIAKGGKVEDTVGRACICNGLSSTAGIGNDGEPPIITLGDDLKFLRGVMSSEDSSYGVKEALEYLLGKGD
jgi:NAD(P)H-dependent flavin oxidoreductase YrpB (nitropropane dioxygenase family)